MNGSDSEKWSTLGTLVAPMISMIKYSSTECGAARDENARSRERSMPWHGKTG